MRGACLVLVIALLAPASALAPPLPPGHADFEITDISGGVMTVRLNWTPSDPGFEPQPDSQVVEHRIYGASSEDDFQVWTPLDSVDMPEDEYILTMGENETAAFYITAVNADGLESAPSNPVIVDSQYPRCLAFSYHLGPPPEYILRPSCILPPPVPPV